jgi:GNAT superfamily N-acetyltransferase
MSHDDRAPRRRRGCEALQAARAFHALAGEPADRHGELGREGRDGVVLVRVEPQDTGRLGGAETDREHRPERDRHLAEDVPGDALTDDGRDAIVDPHRMDSSLEQAEERPLGLRLGRVLVRREADVGCDPRDPLPLLEAEVGEDRDPGDLLRGHHRRHLVPGAAGTRSTYLRPAKRRPCNPRQVGVQIDESLEGIDWAQVKADLVADQFDNGRSAEALRRSFEQSQHVVFARDGARVVGMARLLSDGVCNAYLVDVWTASAYRRRGIGSTIVRYLLDRVPGQHVGLQTGDRQDFYAALGFEEQPEFLSVVVGTWLDNDANR